MIRRELSSSAVNANCTSCGSISTVSQLTGVCSNCNVKVFPAVTTINEDGTVILEDGTIKRD